MLWTSTRLFVQEGHQAHSKDSIVIKRCLTLVTVDKLCATGLSNMFTNDTEAFEVEFNRVLCCSGCVTKLSHLLHDNVKCVLFTVHTGSLMCTSFTHASASTSSTTHETKMVIVTDEGHKTFIHRHFFCYYFRLSLYWELCEDNLCELQWSQLSLGIRTVRRWASLLIWKI